MVKGRDIPGGVPREDLFGQNGEEAKNKEEEGEHPSEDRGARTLSGYNERDNVELKTGERGEEGNKRGKKDNRGPLDQRGWSLATRFRKRPYVQSRGGKIASLRALRNSGKRGVDRFLKKGGSAALVRGQKLDCSHGLEKASRSAVKKPGLGAVIV